MSMMRESNIKVTTQQDGGVFVVAHRSMNEQGGRFAVHVPNVDAIATIRISRLDKVIAISTSRIEATAYLND